jgi:hypothetical protein
MMHFSCDLCGKDLDPEAQTRYVVTIAVTQVFEPLCEDEAEDDRDYLQEIDQILERTDVHHDSSNEPHQEMRYDLCCDCRRRFLRNPLGRDSAKQLDFSQN